MQYQTTLRQAGVICSALVLFSVVIAENDKTIHDAVQDGDLARVRQLLDSDPTLMGSLDAERSETPLVWAALHDRREIAELLIARGASLDHGGGGYPPIHRAIQSGHEELIKLLLEAGADVNGRDELERTPLFFAISHMPKQVVVAHRPFSHEAQSIADPRPARVVALLIEYGAEVNARHAGGDTPLFYAAGDGRADIAELLIEHGAQVDATGDSKRTPLHWAVSSGGKDVVAVLLEAGANPGTKDVTGSTPLDLALENNYDQIAHLLRQKGALNNDERARQRDLISTTQRRLRDLGYDPGPIDGIPGARTSLAIKQFQKEHSLPTTGKLDDRTVSALGLGDEHGGGH